MASGFPVRELGFGVQIPMPTRAEAGSGGLLKRSLTEMERQQQQQQMQMQHAHFLRSVRQRTLLAPHASSHLSPPLLPVVLSSGSSSSVSANLTASGLAQPQEHSSVPQAAGTGVERMRDRLQELERRLLLDEEEEEEEGEVSASSSAVTTAEWSDAMHKIITPQAPVPTPLSSSPTSSSSSTVSSSVSCSPPSTSTATVAAASSSRQMLLDTAAAIADGNLETATANLAVLNRVANSRGDAEQRLTAMMVGALLSRLNPAQAGSTSLPIAALCSGEHFAAAQMLYELSPCFKLGLVAANLAILEATKDQSMIHILDFSLGQGGQYAALLHVLAERHRFQPAVCPPALRITVVADPSFPFTNPNTSGNLRAVGDRIEKLAERAGLEVRFSVVHRRAAELDASTLGCQPGEALAVNLAFALSRVPDESVSPANPRDELLRRVRALRPRVVALVEQDINTSTAAFAGRFAEACAHYGALLESLDATVNRDSAERARVEAGLARRAVNSVAREGMDRVERCEVFGKWRARMRMAGFESVPLGRDVIEPVKARLASVAPDHGFTIREETGGHGLGFGWKGRAITVASAWR
ncbi:scarecrow-like protein 8 [Musa acuminata AAA Group]|uniref:scarecrow-like protein 8 n=1 Tax=Musa acuminata AAA Group TaxID=214697 RepID=UPI0031DF1BD2